MWPEPIAPLFAENPHIPRAAGPSAARGATSTERKGSSRKALPGATDWADVVSHGALLRDNADPKQIVDACNPRFFHQGSGPDSGMMDFGLPP